jgi:nucleoside-diphosphate-sugar epimerase
VVFFTLRFHAGIIYNIHDKVKKKITMVETNKKQRAFVTGSTGFLGQHLCQQLLEQGWKVYALCRNPKGINLSHSNLTVIEGDILKVDAFENQLPHKLDAVFHTAASTNTWFKNNAMQTKTNLIGTQNMLDLAVQKQIVRFIHISSVVVYGIHKQLKNIREDMPKAGIDSWINYVNTKATSENLVLATKGIDAVIINPTHIIGPGDKNNWARLIKMIAHNKLPSIPNGAGSFVDVRDVAAGTIGAFHLGRNGENYLLGGTDLNFKQFVNKVADVLEVKATKTQLPNTVLMALARLKNLISRITNNEPDITPESVTLISDVYACDSAKAREELNYTNRDFELTLSETIKYLQKEEII